MNGTQGRIRPGDSLGRVHVLPPEHRGPIESWEEALSHLDALVESGRPIVVRLGITTTEDRYRSYAEFRGLLRPIPIARRRPVDEVIYEVAPYTIGVAPGRGRFYEPNERPKPGEEGGLNVVALVPDEFAGGRLTTHDGDDYFYLGLDMAGITVVFMDANSH